MNEQRWYVIGKNGVARPAKNQQEAVSFVQDADDLFPKHVPHRAVQLVDAAGLEQANLLIEQQAKRIAELERLNLSFAQNEQKVEQQAKQIESLSAWNIKKTDDLRIIVRHKDGSGVVVTEDYEREPIAVNILFRLADALLETKLLTGQ